MRCTALRTARIRDFERFFYRQKNCETRSTRTGKKTMYTLYTILYSLPIVRVFSNVSRREGQCHREMPSESALVQCIFTNLRRCSNTLITRSFFESTSVQTGARRLPQLLRARFLKSNKGHYDLVIFDFLDVSIRRHARIGTRASLWFVAAVKSTVS